MLIFDLQKLMPSFFERFMGPEKVEKPPIKKPETNWETVHDQEHDRFIKHEAEGVDWMCESVKKDDPQAERKRASLLADGWAPDGEGEYFWVYKKEITRES